MSTSSFPGQPRPNLIHSLRWAGTRQGRISLLINAQTDDTSPSTVTWSAIRALSPLHVEFQMLLSRLRHAAGNCWRRHVIERLRQAARRRRASLLLLLETLEDRTLPAIILDAFNFAGASGSQLAQNPDDVAANITASPITRGPGFTAATTTGAIASTPTASTYGSSPSSAAALNESYQFTLNPQSGYSLSLAGLSFNAWAQNGDSTLAGALQYSLDAGNTFASVTLSGSLSGAAPTSPRLLSASLTTIPALQKDTMSVLFRVYLFGAANGETTGLGPTGSDNDLQVTGAVNPPQVPSADGVTSANVGGGWTGGGIVGQYYNNNTFSGTPSFTRTDDRIDFASNSQAPGGSTAPAYSAVDASNFSVLWTGSLIPAYSQTYTFDGFAADTFILQIAPAGQSNWTTVVSQSAYTGQDFSGTYTFTAGATYNVSIQFVHYTGPWAAQLHWYSPSTPDEVINPISDSGINAVTYDNTTYADAIKMGSAQWTSPTTGNAVATDADGWPEADAFNIVWQGANGPDMAGTYLLQFNGLANVSINFNFATFTVDGQNYSSLPSGVGYNSATNTTTALVNVTNQATICYLNFTNSQRTLASPLDTGVTNVQLMRPTSPGATTYFPPGTVFDPNLEAEYANFTVERWLTANFDTTQVNWSQRILPGNAEADYSDLDEVWEDEVMLANETGKDLYITIPINANTQYVTDLAELIKYGSDGVNPYTSFQANPVYPGLNPNLHLYFEWSNETWNFSFTQSGAASAASAQAAADYLAGNTSAADYANGAIFDYDGLAPIGDYRRWTALMTVEASITFRSIWGDAAIGDQVLPVLEYQYDNDQDTALTELGFIYNYFDNGDGQHVSNPEPVNYYIWGSGAAVYYSSPDVTGTQTAIPIADASFETSIVATNTAVVDPTDSSWTFTGNAGIYNGAGSLGSLGDVQIAPDGTQAAFIGDTGSISTSINFTQTGTFAIQLDAANKYGDENALRIYINGQEITPDYQNDPNYSNPLDAAWTPGQYMFAVSDTNYNSFGTDPFTISTPGNYTLTIVGTRPAGTYTFLDDLQVTSLAAIFNAGIPGNGQALGQSQQSLIGYQAELNAQATFAETFGLHVVAYEGGWSLGGDGGGSPLDNYAKYASTQAALANITSYNDFIQSGGALYIYGTYEQWPLTNTVTANSFPLLQGVDDTNNVLPPAPNNGLVVPAILTAANLTLSYLNEGTLLGTTGWISWNVVVPAYGTYNLTATTTSGGTYLLLLDDNTIASGPSGGTFSDTVTLAPGVHTIQVRGTSGLLNITQVTIAATNTLVGPTLDSAVAGNAEATLNWMPLASATGYQINYGTSSGEYSTSIAVGNVTTFTVPALNNGQSYYFVIIALNGYGAGIPSNEIVAVPLSPIVVTSLASYSFAGFVGNEQSAPGTAALALTVSSLTRGPGLINDGSTSLSANTFASGAVGYAFASYLGAAITDNQFYQFTLTPSPGYTLSLQTLDFAPWFQNATGTANTTRSAGITYSTDGVDFDSGLFASGTANYSPSPFTVDLTGQAALQNTSNTITIRIYVYGSAIYETNGLGSIDLLGNFAVSSIPTTTTLTSLSPLTTTTASPVTFAATVTASSGTAPTSGVVEFFSGTTFLATAPAETTSGMTATFTTSSNVPAGTYGNLQAFYIPRATTWAASSSSVYASTLTSNRLPVFAGATTTAIYGGLGATQLQTLAAVTATLSPTFSLINSPPSWATINSSTGVLTFGLNAPVPNYSTSTTVTITIQAATSAGTATENFTILITPTVSYATPNRGSQQLFDSLPTTTHTPTAPDAAAGGPNDLTASFPTGFGPSDGLSGWYATNLDTEATTNLLAEGPPSGTTTALYDFNNGTTGSQALGVLSDGGTDSSFGEILVNNTGQTLTSFSLSYTGEEWYRGTAGGSQSLQFGYQVGGTTLSSPTGTYVSSLGFDSPDNTAAPGTALDGTLAANMVAVNGTVTGINWYPGQTLILYWNKANGTTGNGDGLGIANLSFDADTFTVSSVTPTSSGVVLAFSAPINPNSTVLYTSPGDTILGSADVSIVSATTGQVRGSLIIDPTNPAMATFVQTAGLLAPGTYTVTVTPAVTSVNGTPLSTTWSSTFTVPTTTGPVLSVPSFARGPGQSVLLTDSLGNAIGIPVSISDAANVTQASFTLTYDPTLLTIAGSGALVLSSAATTAQLTNLAYTLTTEDAHHTLLTVNLNGGAGLTTSTPTPLLTIVATVPTTAPYLNKAILNLSSVVVNSSTATGVSGVDENAYLGNVSGSGTIGALDASLVDQVASGSGTGFSTFKDLDPAIIGAINGSSDVGAVDASLINEAGAGAFIPQIPAVPAAITLTTGGPDPYPYLTALQSPAGGTVTETLYLDVTDPDGIQLAALDEAIAFDAAILQVSNIRPPSSLAAIGSYATTANTDNSTGILLVGQAFQGTGLPPTLPFGTNLAVLQFDVTVNGHASAGVVTPITLLQDGNLNGQTKFTAISDNDGALTWTPGMIPTNNGNAAIDGSVTVAAEAPPITLSSLPTQTGPSVKPPIQQHLTKVVSAKNATIVAQIPYPNHTNAVDSVSSQVTHTETPATNAKVLEPNTPTSAGREAVAPALENMTDLMQPKQPDSPPAPTECRWPTSSTAALDEVYARLPPALPNNLMWHASQLDASNISEPDSLAWLVHMELADLNTGRKSLYASNRR